MAMSYDITEEHLLERKDIKSISTLRKSLKIL